MNIDLIEVGDVVMYVYDFNDVTIVNDLSYRRRLDARACVVVDVRPQAITEFTVITHDGQLKTTFRYKDGKAVAL